MKTHWRSLVGLLMIGVLAVSYYISTTGSSHSHPDEVEGNSDLTVGTSTGMLAPDFVGTTLDGDTVRLSELRGKTVLVNSFASWCGPCLAETPHLVDAFNQSSEDIVFIGLNLQEASAAVSTYRDDYAVTYPLVLDPDGELADIYRPIGLPTSWFIDPQGVVRYVHTGPMTKTLIERALEDVKAGRPFDPFAASG